MGRGKIEIKKIENTTNRQVTFSKRRGGLLKKAGELAILCDAEVGLIIFSSSGKMFEFCSASTSMQRIIERYQTYNNTRLDVMNTPQQIFSEVEKLKDDHNKLMSILRQFTGEDLTTLTMDGLTLLEKQLEISAARVRARKCQLLQQQIGNQSRKVKMLEEGNYLMNHMHENAAMEHQHQHQHQHHQQQMAVADNTRDYAMMEMANFYPMENMEEERNMLSLMQPQMVEYRLQPTQPNLQDHFINNGLQL